MPNFGYGQSMDNLYGFKPKKVWTTPFLETLQKSCYVNKFNILEDFCNQVHHELAWTFYGRGNFITIMVQF